jgi:hypothetical protein
MNTDETTINHRRLIALLSPSWLSGLMAAFGGLGITIGIILDFSVKHSSAGQSLMNLSTMQQSAPQPLTQPGVINTSLENTWPLIAFWAVVGLVVYFIAETIVKALREVAEFRDELSYVHANPDKLYRAALRSFGVRLLIIIIWFIFIDSFFKVILPQCVTWSYAAATNLTQIHAVTDAILAIVVIALSLHLHTIFMRLTFGKVRLLSSALYLDV